jgi:hypothetical protein
MAATDPILLENCQEELPPLGVTREFDFGQFIELFDGTPDPNHPDDPPHVVRIVIDPTATLVAEADKITSPVQSTSSPLMAGSAGEESGEGEVNLFSLTEHGPAAKLPPTPIRVGDPQRFLADGHIEIEGHSWKVHVDDEMREALTDGLTVTTFAERSVGASGTAKMLVDLSVPFEKVSLDSKKLYGVIAGGAVETAHGQFRPELDAEAIQALLDGHRVMTRGWPAGEGSNLPIELDASGGAQELLQHSFEIFDLPQFLAKPRLFDANGTFVDVTVLPDAVEQLVKTGKGQIRLQGAKADLSVMDASRSKDFDEYYRLMPPSALSDRDFPWPPIRPTGMSWKEVDAVTRKATKKKSHFVPPKHLPQKKPVPHKPAGSHHRPAGTGAPIPDPQSPKPEPDKSMTDKVQSRLASGSGLPVAVFVPWRQSWTLKGFSRGNLLHSIALAPQEELTLQVFSWERRMRSLEQSSETEVEQATETTQTTRDTEDVFREMIAKHDFAWQLSASLDASYSTGVASIQFGSNGQVSDTNNVEQTARNSSQQVRESTVKASARVRSKRITRITQTVETGREERVTRFIRNPNQCHTLTLDFFEALAHYEIQLSFIPDRLRLVVLIPNPVQIADYTSDIVRRNETTLRNALIEPAVVDGFDACRTVASYDEAKKLVLDQQAEAAKAEEVKMQRDKPSPTPTNDPAAPQQAEVMRIVNLMSAAVKKIHTDANIDSAMENIRDGHAVTEEMRRNGQYWLFINFVAAKFPAVLTTLDQLSGTVAVQIEDAQKVLSVLPRLESPVNLGNLNDMSNTDKEAAGITSKIKELDSANNRKYLKHDWDWGWWTGRMREEGLYTANDGGIAGLGEQLGRAYKDWEAKKAQGQAMKDQAVVTKEAEGRQDKAGADDKLAMAFPLDELARAYERQKVLRAHLNDHREFYNYALFQAMPPSEQALQIVEASNGRLKVGVFEPRAVAMNGSRLAVPLSPAASTPQLQSFVTSLKVNLTAQFSAGGGIPADTVILPTPGVSASSRLGRCSACEEYIEKAREHELARMAALAEQEAWEATRRKSRVEAKDYDDPRSVPPALKLEIDKPAAP